MADEVPVFARPSGRARYWPEFIQIHNLRVAGFSTGILGVRAILMARPRKLH
jgi:hypothetical protein